MIVPSATNFALAAGFQVLSAPRVGVPCSTHWPGKWFRRGSVTSSTRAAPAAALGCKVAGVGASNRFSGIMSAFPPGPVR